MSYTPQSPEEAAFLASYRIEDFPRPSVAADMAVFSVMEGEEADSRRKDPRQELKVLLVRRGSWPYRGLWALPGGFVTPDETVEETARRELFEETGVPDAHLVPFASFSAPDRDPRGRILSLAHLALIDASRYRVHAGTDAWEADWFRIDVTELERMQEQTETGADVRLRYRLVLFCARRDLTLSAELALTRSYSGARVSTSCRITEQEGLAFDHAEILLRAFLELRSLAGGDSLIVFDLMPERFTLKMLQMAYEAVLGRSLLTPNFRRKAAEWVEEADGAEMSGLHRPARYFRRKPDVFYR